MTAKIFGNSYDINAKTLILYDTKLEYLPESISKFVNLKILNLSRNNLVVLPTSIGKVINLNYLYLPYNRLIQQPMRFVLMEKQLKIAVKPGDWKQIVPCL